MTEIPYFAAIPNIDRFLSPVASLCPGLRDRQMTENLYFV
jgi:hypothetical protein